MDELGIYLDERSRENEALAEHMDIGEEVVLGEDRKEKLRGLGYLK